MSEGHEVRTPSWAERLGPMPLWASAAVLAVHVALRFGPVGLGLLAASIGAVGAALPRAARSVVAATFGVVIVVGASALVQSAALERGPLVDLAQRGGTAEVVVTVVSEPRPSSRGWWAVVRVDSQNGVGGRARALWRGDGDEPLPILGSRWEGASTARPLGRSGFDAYLRSLHVAVRLDPVRAWRSTAGPGPASTLSERARASVRDNAARALPATHAGLAVGLVTGDTRLLPPNLEARMRSVGLTHLVAVSGSNVAIVLIGLSGLATVSRLGARGKRRLMAIGLIAFVFLVRWEPSVVRAACMAGVVLLAGRRGRLADPRHALASTILVLMIVDPFLAFSLGLALSAAAAAGVLVVAPAIRERLNGLPGPVAELLSVTLGAQLAVAPVLMLIEGEVGLVTVPANLVAVPAAAVASAASLSAAVVGPVLPLGGDLLYRLAGPALGLIVWAADSFSARGGVVSFVRPWTVVAVAAALTALVSRRQRWRRSVALGAVAGLLGAA